MIKLNIKLQNENCLDEISNLKNFLKEDWDFKNPIWIENLQSILNLQSKDGSFKLVSSNNLPSDARVDFYYIPTYVCTAILMKAYLLGNSNLNLSNLKITNYSNLDLSDSKDLKLSNSINTKLYNKIEKALIKGLKISTLRNLKGHGYDGFKGQIDALNIFIGGGLREFIDLHEDLSPEFTKMILNIKSELESKENFTGPWGESYEEDIIKINEYFNHRLVFTYGTLMNGESNHGFLSNSEYLESTYVEGYDMYNVGFYPAIVPGDSEVIGELYEVPESDMDALDSLEGEGSLYIRKCELIPLNNRLAYIYVYNQDVSYLEKINSWKDYVWYVSYGSNMLYDRFLCYIKGGAFEDGGSYNEPCRDTSLPIKVKSLEIPYDMYFGNTSGSWNGCGVSFLDTTKKGNALAVAYLITREQFEHVAAEENCGRFPDGYGFWYENIKSLGELDGYELVTITNDELRPYNDPCEEYLKTLTRGIKENWPEMSDEDIADYLESCIR